jgi:hypothetical protein
MVENKIEIRGLQPASLSPAAATLQLLLLPLAAAAGWLLLSSLSPSVEIQPSTPVRLRAAAFSGICCCWFVSSPLLRRRGGGGTHEEASKYVFSRDLIEWRVWWLSRSGFSFLLFMASRRSWILDCCCFMRVRRRMSS